MSISIVLADDHSVVRQGLRMFLSLDPELKVIGEAANGLEAVQLARRLNPDVVLMDLLMPEMNGLEATAAIRREALPSQVIVLTSVLEDAAVSAVIRAGAIGYLLKDTEADELRRAIKTAAAGHVQLSPRVAARLLAESQAQAGLEAFTDRENEVLKLAAQGLSDQQIASQLLVSEPAVRGYLSDIVDRLRLADQTQAALLEFSNRLLQHSDPAALLEHLASETPRLLNLDACAVLLPGEGPHQLVFQAASGWGQDPAVERQRLLLIDESAGPGWVMRHGQPWQVEDLGLEVSRPAVNEIWCRDGFRGHTLIPMLAEGRVIGVLSLNSRQPRRLHDDELRFLRLLANQAALVVEQARLIQAERQQHGLEEDLAVARQIQLSLLPEACPQVPGWEFAAVYRSARLVGGDLYDFVELPALSDHWGLLIADVSGKGAAAALFMAHSRAVIRAAALSRPRPAETLSQANDLILRDNQTSHFVSAFYGVLDSLDGRLTYANAGHNHPFWWQADTGQVVALASEGSVLGLIAGAAPEEQQVTLAPDDLLVLYTDGITEAVNPALELFGEERLAGVIAATAQQGAEVAVHAILDAVLAFSGEAPQADDFTLVALKRLASHNGRAAPAHGKAE